MQDWDGDSESGQEQSAGAKILQSCPGSETHFQQEECQDSLEHAFKDRLDGFPAFGSHGRSDDQASDQQHGGWCTEEFVADGEQSGTSGRLVGIAGRQLSHLEGSDGQSDLNTGNFEEGEKCGHESFSGGSCSICELLGCDEGDGRDGSVVGGNAGGVGDAEFAEASEHEVGGDRREAAEQQSDCGGCCEL